jgi:hypothetical protein
MDSAQRWLPRVRIRAIEASAEDDPPPGSTLGTNNHFVKAAHRC